jgi:hypothetical protein
VLAIVLLFLKKVGVFIIAGLALLGGWLRRVFNRRRDALEGAEYHQANAPEEPAPTPSHATDAPPPEGEAPPPQPTG